MADVWAGDVMSAFSYAQDETGAIWWAVTDYRSGLMGYVQSDLTIELDAETASVLMAQIDAEKQSRKPRRRRRPSRSSR